MRDLFVEYQSGGKMIRQTRVFRIRTRGLPNLGVAVEVFSDSKDNRCDKSARAPMLLASKSYENTRAVSVHPLSRTRKVELLKSIADAIRTTWEARHSDAQPSPIPGLIGRETSPLLGRTEGAV